KKHAKPFQINDFVLKYDVKGKENVVDQEKLRAKFESWKSGLDGRASGKE
ncbi:unnamed protein product, partial [marine sediment metagenome]